MQVGQLDDPAFADLLAAQVSQLTPEWELKMEYVLQPDGAYRFDAPDRIAAFADMHNVRTGCHGATDLSPVCMAAALHVDVSIPNFGVQEHMHHTEETDAVFPHAYRYAEGMMHPGDEPGLGVDIDEEAAARFPYKRAFLPVNRLEDGTMFNW